MKDYGKLFKKFRESRGLVLKDIAKLGVSVSHISRFERENTDLTISKFMSALNAINMPIDEFMYAANDFQRDEFNEILEKISLFVSARNVSGMEKLLISQVEKIEKRETFYTLNTILIKIRLQDLSDKSYYDESDIQCLPDYLFSVEYWGCYELLLFANTVDVLNHQTMMLLSREMCKRSEFYKDLPNYRRLHSTMLLNCYIISIERDEYIDSLYFEKQLNHSCFTETEIYEKLVFHYSKNLYELKKNRSNKAILEMKKCIAAMKLANSENLAIKFENHLSGVLKM